MSTDVITSTENKMIDLAFKYVKSVGFGNKKYDLLEQAKELYWAVKVLCDDAPCVNHKEVKRKLGLC